jgi:alkylmercury lyase-like protein
VDDETKVKMHVYETLAKTAAAPTVESTAMALDLDAGTVAGAFASLNRKRLLVPEPGDPSRIRMAPPFSGVPTPHVVTTAERSYFANCAWDTFGIAAALQQDADIRSTCMDCGEALSLRIQDQQPRPDGVLFHIAVPAARWWADIIHT